jgi:hypothetical protein
MLYPAELRAHWGMRFILKQFEFLLYDKFELIVPELCHNPAFRSNCARIKFFNFNLSLYVFLVIGNCTHSWAGSH